MTGNTTRLGLAVSDLHINQILRLSMVLALFVAGSAAGEFIALRAGRRRPARGRVTVLAVTALLLTACGALAAYGLNTGVVCCAVLAMGVLNAAFEKVQGQAVGLTYVTGSLAHIGQALGKYLSDGERPRIGGYVVTFGGLLAGVIAGAVLQHKLPEAALWLCAGLAWSMMLIAWRNAR
jgi:uncharacterized membrane protein YoaK (UPF0700 family)